MDFTEIHQRGLVVLGCGKMGSALLAGWLDSGLSPTSVFVQDPAPSQWLGSLGVHVNEDWPPEPAVLLIAVKPQVMREALATSNLPTRSPTLIVSVAAGTPIREYESAFGQDAPVIRTMPNTPAAIGRGITAMVGNRAVEESHLRMAEALMSSVGQTVRLESEIDMDAVTALSGSGPAYVFHMIEALAAAGQSEGLPADVAMRLAKATVAGAGALAEASEEGVAQLRKNVTSPAGTTEAALNVLMDEKSGLPPLMKRTVAAAAERSRELSK